MLIIFNIDDINIFFNNNSKIQRTKLSSDLIYKIQHYTALKMLKVILKKYYNISDQMFDISKSLSGKPYVIINGDKLCVSISHSDEITAIGISRYNFGIDIEPIKEFEYDIRCYSDFFTESEISCALMSRDVVQYSSILWTKKEAAIKYLDAGLKDLKDLYRKKYDDVVLNSYIISIKDNKYAFSCMMKPNRINLNNIIFF